MDLEEILSSLGSGRISAGQAKKLLSLYSIERVEDFAKIDMGRGKRRGIPEVVFAETKQSMEVKKIIERVMKKADSVVVSRVRRGDQKIILDFAKKSGYKVRQGRNCSTLAVYKKAARKNGGRVGILAAGTSDIGVAEEARLMAESMGCQCIASYDVGVAGIHRVMPVLKEFVGGDVDAVIVAAGMEGALATMVASLVDIPVIGVPTSVGYGYGERGIAALASMLQSCSLGLSVVNIDNGIAAGAVAANIARRAGGSARRTDCKNLPRGSRK